MVKSTISAYGQGLIAENDRGAETGITFTFAGFSAGVGFVVSDSRFEVVLSGVQWVLRLRAEESLNYETAHTHDLTIRATDSAGNTATTEVTVNVNASPAFAQETYSENIALGATIGSTITNVAATDAEGDTLTYAITAGNDAGLFDIDGRGNILLAVPDTRTNPGDHTLTVTATDTAGNTDTTTIRITDYAARGTDIRNYFDGTNEAETIYGYDGDDDLDGRNGDDIIYGGDGNDTLNGGAYGDDVLYGGAGNDYIMGHDGEDILYGDSGDDRLSGGDGVDSLYGGDGDDSLVGGAGDDTLYGGSGNDELWGFGGADILYGEAGDDLLTDYGGDSKLYGGVGNDRLYGREGDDILYGGAGDDNLNGGEGEDRLYGNDGGDRLYGGYGEDTLYGGAGVDYLYGGYDEDTLYGDGGDDRLHGGAEDDVIYGGAGDDRLDGDGGDDRLNGDAGDDRLDGDSGDDTLYGGSGDDILYGDYGDDTLYGGAGDDFLTSNSGDDALVGGAGVDFMIGGADADVFVLNMDTASSDDADVVMKFTPSEGDKIGVAGFDAGWLTMESFLAATNLRVEKGHITADGFSGFFDSDDPLIKNTAIYHGDALAMVLEDFTDDLTLDMFDVFVDESTLPASTNQAPVFSRKSKIATIAQGAEIGSTVAFITATDAEGDALTYSIIAGNDAGLFDIDDAGNILLAIPDKRTKPATHRLKIIATDTAGNTDTASVRIIDYAARGTDGDDGLYSYYTEEAHVIYGYGGDDRLSSYSGATTLYGGSGDDRLSGSSGNDTLYGDSGNDNLSGGGGNDALYGGTGDDRLSGRGGDDTLHGGDGDDTLYGGDDEDTLHGGTGDDILYGEDGNDRLYGNAGNDNLYGNAGNDTLYGGDGDDRLSGGADDDTLRGDAGDDYLYGGAGEDTLYGDDGDDTLEGGGGSDRLDGGDGADLLLGGGGDDHIYGDDGNDALTGGDGDDRLDGGAGEDTLYGDDGDDRLDGGDGDDTLSGGAGTDTLTGGAGADIFMLGSDSDTVVDFTPNDGDKIRMDDFTGVMPATMESFLTAANLRVEKGHISVDGLNASTQNTAIYKGDVLLMVLEDFTDDLTLDMFDLPNAMPREVPDFSQDTYRETIVRGAEIGSIIINVAPIDANDDLTYAITAGNDAGLFDIDGAGNILLAVPDAVTEAATHTLTVTATNGDGNSDTATIYITDYAMRGTDGDDRYFSPDDSDGYLYGGAGDDNLDGGAGDDTLYGGAGRDSIYGGAGDDTLYGGDRADNLNGDSGDDTLYGGAGDDNLDGDGGDDTLYGADGEDFLRGNDGDDTLHGGVDDDAIFGHSGDDALYGGSGDDYLDGGSGTNLFYGGAGADVFHLNEREYGGIYFRPVATDIIVDFNSADGDHLVLRNRVIPVQGTFNPSSIKDLETDGGLRFDTSGNRVIKGHESGENDADIHDTVIYIGDTIIAVLEDFTDLTPDMIHFAVTGSDDDDIIHGSDGGNNIEGKGGDDTIYGGAGDDTIYGDVRIYGYFRTYSDGGDDTIHGGAGDDTILGGAGTDQINGDGGDDFLAGGDDNDQINGGAGDDEIYGGDGDDTMHGGTGDDRLYGGADDDTIHGGDGDDTLHGNSGNDVLYGGAGDDFLVGHYGADIFVLDADDAGVDIVGDFSVFKVLSIFYRSDKISIASVESSTPITSLEELYDIANLRVEKGHITRPNYDTTRDDKSIENTAIYMDDALVMVLEDFDRDLTLSMFDLPNAVVNQAPEFSLESYTATLAEDAAIGSAVVATHTISKMSIPITFYGVDFTFSLDGETITPIVHNDGETETETETETEEVTTPIATTATDVDGDDLTYSIIGGDGFFAIDADSGEITLTGALDYETATSHTFTIQVEDSGGLTDTAEITINVENVNEAPEFAQETYTATITRGAEIGDIITNIAATDADSDTLTYSITAGNDAGLFIVDATNGDIKLAVPETRTDATDHTLTITATDTAGNTGTATVTITDYAIRGTDEHDYTRILITYHHYGWRRPDEFIGPRNPSIEGTDEADTIYGYAGNDKISGGDGDDIIYGGGGRAGDDTTSAVINVAPSDNDETPSDDADDVESFLTTPITITIIYDADVLYGDDGDDTLYGGIRNDQLYGGNDADTLYGGSGKDFLEGEGGIDVLYGGADKDTFYIDIDDVGAGDTDIIVDFNTEDGDRLKLYFEEVEGTFDASSLEKLATTGDLHFDTNGNALSALQSEWNDADINDVVIYKGDIIMAVLEDFTGFTTNVIDFNIWGEDGDDTFHGSGGDDKLVGGGGVDTLYGGAGGDFLGGGSGDDTLYGEDGKDDLYGNYGDDTLYGGDGNDYLQGGYDRYYPRSARDYGNDILYGGAGNDTLYGDYGRDTLHGGADRDRLNGDYGNDTLYGGAGNDSLNGGSDNDILDGGSGNDYLTGGSGADIFVLDIDATSSADVDIVTDFHDHDKVRYQVWGLDNNDHDKIRIDGFTGAMPETLDDFLAAANLRVEKGHINVPNAQSDDLISGGVYGVAVSLIDSATIEGTAIYKVVEGGADVLLMVLRDFTDDLTLDMFDLPNAGTNTAPTFAQDSYSASIAQGAEAGDIITNIAAQDADSDTLTYSITAGNDAGLFIVDATNGDIKLAVPETRTNAGDHTLTITATDTAGNSDTATVTITDYAIRGTGDDDVGQDYDTPQPYYVLALIGTDEADTIYGYGGHDLIRSGDGADIIYGGAGNDDVRGGDDDDTLYGGAGNDRLSGERGDDIIYGGDGDDILSGRTGDDAIYGDAGDDTVSGFYGDDTLYGGAGDDDVSGYYGTDTLYGGSGADYMRGGEGNDILYGGSDNDTLAGNEGDDTLHGDGGGDDLHGGDGADTLYGGDGVDTLYGDAGDDTLYGGDASDVLYGDAGVDTLNGGAGGDVIYGGADNDILNGEAGNDLLEGSAGTDTLYGGAGSDYLRGDSLALIGTEIFTGPADADIFVLNTADSGTDTITDFTPSAGDKIRIEEFTGVIPGSIEAFLTAANLRIEKEHIKVDAWANINIPTDDNEITNTAIYSGDRLVMVLEDFDADLTLDMFDLPNATPNTAPVFAQESYTATLAENAESGSAVIAVQATDANAGDTFTYSIVSNNIPGLFVEDTIIDNTPPFAIDANSGAITLTGALDFETATTHTFTIQVEDSAGLTDTAEITINVTDAPVFDKATHRVEIPELTEIGTTLTTVTARDADTSALRYSILGGRNANLFAINENTGAITLKGFLDFETAESHRLVVQASDDVSTDTINVIIGVVDEMDCACLDIAANTEEITAGTVLTASITHDDPNGYEGGKAPESGWVWFYQSKPDQEIGDGSATYTVREEDSGEQICVRITYMDGNGRPEIVQARLEETVQRVVIKPDAEDADKDKTYTAEADKATKVEAGTGADHVRDGNRNDVIDGGKGDDEIDLSASKTDNDVVIYGIGNQMASDGADSITSFVRGRDKFVFQLKQSDIDAGNIDLSQDDGYEGFINYVTKGTEDLIDDQFWVNFNFSIGENGVQMDGISFHFKDSTFFSGGRISMPIVSIEFADPLSVDEVREAYSGRDKSTPLVKQGLLSDFDYLDDFLGGPDSVGFEIV